jgi:hypothetical protein
MSDNDKKLYVVDLLYSLSPTKSDDLQFKSCLVKSVVLARPTTSYVWKRIVSQSLSLGLEQETVHRQETGQTTIIINQGSSVISPTPRFQWFWLERHSSFEGGKQTVPAWQWQELYLSCRGGGSILIESSPSSLSNNTMGVLMLPREEVHHRMDSARANFY